MQRHTVNTPRVAVALFALTVFVPLWLVAVQPSAAAKPEPSLLKEYLSDRGLPRRVVYATRPLLNGGHAYETFGWRVPKDALGDASKYQGNGVVRGGQIRIRDLASGEDSIVLEDPDGSIRDPYVHYDGRRILFSWRKGTSPTHHLYEIRSDGKRLRQITRGPYDDVEPCYLPDGGIVFVSSRARRWVPCFVTQVGLIHRCGSDGSDIRMLTCNMDHDLRPWVLRDGRICFTRWEYVDRHEEGEWDLWAMRPDGAGLGRLFREWLVDARPIPGTGKLIAINANKGSKDHVGNIVTLDLAYDPDETLDRKTGARPGYEHVCRTSRDSARPRSPRDPIAVSERWVFYADRDGIRLLKLDGKAARPQTQLVIPNPDARDLLSRQSRHRRSGRPLACHEPRPLIARQREPVLPRLADHSKQTGRLLISDVHADGRSLKGVKRGDIRSIAVYELLPVPIKFKQHEPGQISMGSTWNLKRYLGAFPVEADGSACVDVPARRTLQLIALDKNDRGIKRMHAGLSVTGGETLGCIGCHENRSHSPGARRGRLALRRTPSKLRIETGLPADGIVDYVRTVQPIWNRRCMPCHDSKTWAGKLALDDHRGAVYMNSAFLLVWRGQVLLPSCRGRDNPEPRTLGSAASPLMNMLDGSHHKARLSEQERRTVRIWIDGGGLYSPTYACADTGHRGLLSRKDEPLKTCFNCHSKSEVYRKKFGASERKNARRRWPKDVWTSYLVDLNDPSRSLLVRVPLAKEAGGLGWCRTARGDAVLTDKSDPTYKALEKLLPETGPDRRVSVNSFERDGFKPNGGYLAIMKAYGAMQGDIGRPVDLEGLLRLDESYYKLFYSCAADAGPGGE